MSDGNPQLEGGYIRLANELYDAILKWPFTATELKIVMVILRKTYGFRKTQDVISLSQFDVMTGIKKQNTNLPLRALIDRKIVNCEGSGQGRLLSINKHYHEWSTRKVIKAITPKVIESITEEAKKSNEKDYPKYSNPLPKVIESITKPSYISLPQKTKDNLKTSLKTEPSIKKEPAAKTVKPKFTPPTIQEVADYILAIGAVIEPEYFLDYYEANGWVQGGSKKPIVSWKACVRTWKHNSKKRGLENGTGKPAFKTIGEQVSDEMQDAYSDMLRTDDPGDV